MFWVNLSFISRHKLAYLFHPCPTKNKARNKARNKAGNMAGHRAGNKAGKQHKISSDKALRDRYL